MRMRAKPWATPELNACDFFVRKPFEVKNNWNKWFKEDKPLHLELGCGKGMFIAGIAPLHPEYNYLGIDMKDAVLAPGKREIEKAFGDKPITNVALTAYDIERLTDIMGENDHISRIYINFCNPWPKPKHRKRRLTHTRQLEIYKPLLVDKGEIWFKTDNLPLFEDSLKYFKEAGFEIDKITYDLHAENLIENIVTEHEKMFSEQGIKIKALRAHKL